ncbi:MAG: EAL domain-containing protein [Lachnospiraceae bacterium]|nr:EAL domain-containing protein [Lachnospiraceae bacterium]
MGNDFHFACFFAAFVISVTCMVFTFTNKRTDKLQNKLYIWMLIIVVCNSFSGMIIAIGEPMLPIVRSAMPVVLFAQFTYFVLHAALCPLFFLYVSIVSGLAYKQTHLQRAICSLPFFVTEIMTIMNPHFRWIFYYNSNYEFTRGKAEIGIYLAAALYFLMSILLLWFSWKAINLRRRFAIVYFFVIVVAGVIIQFLDQNVKGELFAEALALMGLMLAVEMEDDLVDVNTGFYNRKALRMDVNNYLVNKTKVDLVCLKVSNADIIQKVTGSANVDLLAEIVSGYLKSIVPRFHIYQTNPETFVLVILDRKRLNGDDVAQMLEDRFKQTWEFKGMDILLNAEIMSVKLSDELTNTVDLFYMVDSVVNDKTTTKILYSKDLDHILRRGEMENAIARGLDENGFEVYYQPTFHLNGLKLHGAEALVRLNDPVMGRLFPDEFIPIAEQIGMIEMIDDYVLRQVCEFLQSGVPQKYGIENINVNLSVLQCLKPGFVDHICGIVEEYDVDKKTINFEITESVAASDYEMLSVVVSDLKKHGFRFAMDDYGTGYSNMQSIFSLDFDIVKIDKSLLWGAEETELGRIILGNSIKMIDQMGRRILVEGVETKEQLEMLKELSVDYLQGFYFSKPIPQNEFIEYIKKEK